MGVETAMMDEDVRDGEILIEGGCGDELLYGCLVLAEGRVDESHVC